MSASQTVPRLTLNQEEAAAALGVSVDHFNRHIKGDLPTVITGRRKLYPVAALERWVEEHSLQGGRRVA